MTRNEKLTHAGLMILLAVYVVFGLAIMSRGDSLDTSGWRASTETRTQASLWNWSPRAAHHQAVVQVLTKSTGHAGSGVYLSHDGVLGVLSARHVASRGKATCTFTDGSVQTGDVHYDKFRHDVAFVVVQHPSIQPLTLALNPPNPGTQVEFVSYGGPKDDSLRHFWGVARGDGNYGAVVVSGDSGCPILDSQGRVIGIETDGLGHGSIRRDWPTFQGAKGVGLASLRAFCDRVAASLHQGGGPHCHPSGPIHDGCQPGQGGGFSDMYPPKREQPPQKDVPPGFIREPYADENGVLPKWKERYPSIALPGPADVQPKAEIPIPGGGGCGPCAKIDELRAVIEALEVRVKGMEMFPGQPGENGLPGPPGPKGEKGDPGEISEDDLKIFAAGVAAGLLDNEKFIAAVAGLVKVPPATFIDHGPITFQLLDKDGKVRIQNGKPAEYRAGYAREEGEKVEFQLVPVPKAK